MKQLTCTLVSPDAQLFRGEVWQVSVPAASGRFAIRTGHVPVVASVAEGVVEIARSEEQRMHFKVTDAVIALKENNCSIICESAESV